MGIQALPSGICGPLPPGTVSLILGRSSTILRGIQVHPGVIDQDSQGEIKIMTSVKQGMVAIPKGERIAQLILLPSAHTPAKILKPERGEGGLASTGPAVFWTADMTDRPQLVIYVEDRPFKGILDTGADLSILSGAFWPKAWPRETAPATLQGIGQAWPHKSLKILKWRDEGGHSGYFQPYILEGLPTNLWGRDLLQEMNVVLTTQPANPADLPSKILPKWGGENEEGLGKQLQEKTLLVAKLQQVARATGDQRGLGHFY